ncbi:MAG: hypothetical protein ACREBZ_01180, partial [Thermoplasmata archaeon]
REEGKPPFEVLLSPPADLRLEVGCYALILSGGERLPQLLEWIRVAPGRPIVVPPRPPPS